MKLRNKKTGEIKEFTLFDGNELQGGVTLESLTKEWEDAPEEREEYWYVDADGEIICEPSDDRCEFDNNCREIGNYFETEEEAEKAVEKLKALKRLKDKGFRFTGIAGNSNNIYVSFETDDKYRSGHVMYDEYSNTDNKLMEYNEDLMMLFGGEE